MVLLFIVFMFYVVSWGLLFVGVVVGVKFVFLVINEVLVLCNLFIDEGIIYLAGVLIVWLVMF